MAHRASMHGFANKRPALLAQALRPRTRARCPRLTTRFKPGKSLIEVGGVLSQVLFPVAEGKIHPGPCCRESFVVGADRVAGKRNESALQRLIIEGISDGSACHWLSPRRWFG